MLLLCWDTIPNHHFDFEKNDANDPPQDLNPTQDAFMADTMHNKDLEEDLCFVDMHDFHQLQSHFDELNKVHAKLNQNKIIFMKLVKIFMSFMQQPSVIRNASLPQASASPLPTSSLYGTHTTLLEIFIKDTLELIKNLKPPIFKNENKERNKDNVDTFLRKWAKTHDMQATHDKIKPRHTCAYHLRVRPTSK